MAKKKKEYAGEFGVNNQIFFCGVPFRLDSYQGCSHQCRYCFARSSDLTNYANTDKQVGRILIPDSSRFTRILSNALEFSAKRADINYEWLKHRVPIHWGGMSDPFQPCEAKYKVTKTWMNHLNWYHYPVAISTKGTTLLTSDEYFQLLKEGNYAVQVTLIGNDEAKIKQIEPGAPTVTERLLALEKIAEAGIWTAVRIQPVFVGTDFERNLPEFIEQLSNVGVKHVLAEGYKVPMRSEEWMKEIWTMFPEMADEFKAYNSKYFGFEKLLPSWRKWKYIKVIRDACHENGMTFGAADNDMRDFGDTICCCGLDNIPGFENFWRYQASQAVWIAKEKGVVTLDDMQQFWSGGNDSMDSGNVLNEEMYQEIYGYKKGHAPKNNKKDSGGLLGIQDGEMRREARATGTRYTAKYCVDWIWNDGGECSPEGIYSLTKAQDGENIIYRYKDPIPSLEASDIRQASMFEYIKNTESL